MTTELPPLVGTEWLERNLEDPVLRVFDCTVAATIDEQGFHVASGRPGWEQSHIPGCGFLDLLEDLSDRASPLPVMMPPAEQFAEVMRCAGISDDSRVVLYDRGGTTWAARVWWMLRAFGFDRAALLDGGWSKWQREQRPVSSELASYLPGSFTVRARAGLIASRDEVLAALSAGDVRLVNALSAEEHAGKVSRVARPGRIPGSVNVPAGSLVDPATGCYRSRDELASLFERANARDRDRVITYCGGGIAACGVAFALTLLGDSDVAVYDGSLAEWSADPALPLISTPER